jgi:hypothetical protein
MVLKFIGDIGAQTIIFKPNLSKNIIIFITTIAMNSERVKIMCVCLRESERERERTKNRGL